MITGENNLLKVAASATVDWSFQVQSGANKAKLTFSVVAGPDAENAPEWSIIVIDATDGEIWSTDRHDNVADISLPGSHPKEFTLQVTCPNGARFGDTVRIEVDAEADDGSSKMVFDAVAVQSIMALKTQLCQEEAVALELGKKAVVTSDKDIYAILNPVGLRGYVFVEGMNTDRVREKAKEIKKARGFIMDKKGNGGKYRSLDEMVCEEIDIKEIGPYLTPMSAVVGIVEGDIVELINGPFKGEKARVQQIDQGKEEITVELIEAMVPIPVTVKGDSVRLIEKEK